MAEGSEGGTEWEEMMALDNNFANESYNRCLTELRERYKGRGISESVKSETALQVKNEASTRAIAPGAYVLFDSRSKIADTYRSGEYNGSKYMTSEDFVRYFKTRRAFYMPRIENEPLPEEAELRGGVVRKNAKGASRAGLVKGENAGKEAHLQNVISALKVFQEKWFPIERKEGRAQVGSFRFPVATASGLAVFAISLGLIVGGSVMTGSASGKVGQLKTEVATLEAKQNELQSLLDLKYNIDEIESEAKLLGMVKRQAADNEYVSMGGEEQIVVFEDGESEKSGLMALLSAFGIEID